MEEGSITEEYADAKIEESYYSILNFFYFVKAKYIRIYFEYAGYRYNGLVEEVENNFIRLSLVDFRDTPERKAVLKFEALNRYYSCSITIVRSNELGVFILIPKKLIYLARRRHLRLSYDDLFMRFTILYSPFLESRQVEKIMESKYPYFMSEVLVDNPSVSILHKMFVAEMRKVASEFSVRMLYSTPKEELSIAERIVMETGKSFLIQDVAHTASYIQQMNSNTVLNYKSWYEHLLKNSNEYEALNEIEKLKQEDARQFLVSYMMVPIFLFGLPIGYFRLETDQFNKHLISVFDAEDIYSLSGLFSYAMTKNQIRRSHFNPSSVQTRVVNISLSGLLMELTDEILYMYLQKHRRIKMLIPILGKEIEMYGEIKRFFESDGFFYFGVQFFKNRPGDIIFLENFLYEDTHNQFF